LQFEIDAQTRIDGYRRVEDIFFGEGGLFPAIPCFLRIETQAMQTWLDRTLAVFGGQHYNTWIVDWEAKKAAQGN